MTSELRLNCTRCGEFKEYEHDDESNVVVYCDDCGKKHSDASLFMVESDATFERDESGDLLEKPY